MGFPDYRRDLLSDDFDANYILDRYFHSGESVVFAGANPAEEAKLKNDVSSRLYSVFNTRIHHLQLIICGSAHLGFSPVPTKLGKPFNPLKSDIDLSVVSSELFDLWWTELQASGLEQAQRDTISRELFWGFINPANVRDVSQAGQRWWETFGALQTDRAAGVRGRLYRTFWSMQNYHKIAVFQGREILLREKVGTQ